MTTTTSTTRRPRWIIMLTVLGVLLIAGGILAAYMRLSAHDDLRTVVWGANQAAVMRQERAALESKGPDVLMYRDTIFTTLPVALGYYFEDDALVSVKYVSMTKYRDVRVCLADVHLVQEQVLHRYGRPELLVDEQFREASWTTADAQISLKLIPTSQHTFLWLLEFQPLSAP